jgi:hypothetical protein
LRFHHFLLLSLPRHLGTSPRGGDPVATWRRVPMSEEPRAAAWQRRN